MPSRAISAPTHRGVALRSTRILRKDAAGSLSFGLAHFLGVDAMCDDEDHEKNPSHVEKGIR